MELISVIVPVYNVEKYLEKCVDSLINQTYKNLEIILVNDGSTDNSGKLADRLAEKDTRIVVIHKENEGVSTARNMALEIAKGKYITFVDSDDYIALEMLEKLYEIAEKDQTDFVESNFNLVFDNNIKKYTDEEYYLELDQKEYLREYLLMTKLFGATWGKIIKSDIAKSIKFPTNQPIYEDMEYQYQLIKKSNKIILTSQPYYNYVMRGNSETHSEFKEKNMYLFDVFNRIKNYTLSKYPELKDEVASREMYAYFGMFNQIILLNNYKKNKYYNQVKSYLRDNLWSILKNPYITRNRKISTLLIVLNSDLYKIVLKKFMKGLGKN